MTSNRFLPVVVTLAVVCFAQLGFGADNIFVQAPTTYDGPDYVPGQIIVKFRPGVPESAMARIHRANNATVARRSRFADFQVLTFPESIPPQAMANIYAKNPNVEYAELNYIAHTFFAPNDTYYGYQWHLKGIGMEQAWEISTGAGVKVAIVDTGVSARGSDSFIDLLAGRDFVNNDYDADDDNGHGTHVAGTIAQKTNNDRGVAGVAYNCTILPVKVLGADGSGQYAWIADGIRYAADQGAKVINMSLGSRFGSITLESAVAYAYSKGVTIVCASGNDGSKRSISYPAAYDAYCIAVGATRYDEAVAPYSNRGPSLDLTAPGGDTRLDQNKDGYVDGVLQETFNGATWGYYFFQGTSMAAPHVSGVAALVISKGIAAHPDDVRNVLQSTAKDKGTKGWDSTYGWGIVDAYAALGGATVAPTLQSIAVTPTSASIFVGGTQQFTATGTYSDGSTQNLTVAWSSSDTDVATISTSGLAEGITAGTDPITITATFEGKSGTASLTVNAVTLESIAVAPNSASIAVGGTQQFIATATYSNGTTENITSSVAWSSSDESVATVGTSSIPDSTPGLATGVGEGADPIAITAAIEGKSGTASLTVTGVPSTGTLCATITGITFRNERKAGNNYFVTAVAYVEIEDGNGNPVSGASVTGLWSGAAKSTSTGTTDEDGVVMLTTAEVKVKPGATFILDITDVIMSGYTFDPYCGRTQYSEMWP